MADQELLRMLAGETDRRLPAIRAGLKRLTDTTEPDPAAAEKLRVEVHGLRGAAMVTGQSGLAALAEGIERAIADRAGVGVIDAAVAACLSTALDAFVEGVGASAAGDPEPPLVAESLAALS